jgi:hypothetical protein
MKRQTMKKLHHGHRKNSLDGTSLRRVRTTGSIESDDEVTSVDLTKDQRDKNREKEAREEHGIEKIE